MLSRRQYSPQTVEVFSAVGPWVIRFVCTTSSLKRPTWILMFSQTSGQFPRCLFKIFFFREGGLSSVTGLYGIHETFQSSFKSCNRTETALLRVCNDLLLTVDSAASAVSVLLHLPATVRLWIMTFYSHDWSNLLV